MANRTKEMAIDGKWWIHVDGRTFCIDPRASETARQASSNQISSSGKLISPMPATVRLIHAKDGDSVKAGQTLAVLEAMKMEYQLTSPFNGVVQSVHCSEGDQIARGDLVVEVEQA